MGKQHSSLRQLRFVGLLEGVSFLVLLLIAMPLKYAFGMPMPVRIVGSIHGGLFVLFVIVAFRTAWVCRWPLARLAFALLMSVIPAGTFWLDRVLRREEVAHVDSPR